MDGFGEFFWRGSWLVWGYYSYLGVEVDFSFLDLLRGFFWGNCIDLYFVFYAFEAIPSLLDAAFVAFKVSPHPRRSLIPVYFLVKIESFELPTNNTSGTTSSSCFSSLPKGSVGREPTCLASHALRLGVLCFSDWKAPWAMFLYSTYTFVRNTAVLVCWPRWLSTWHGLNHTPRVVWFGCGKWFTTWFFMDRANTWLEPGHKFVKTRQSEICRLHTQTAQTERELSQINLPRPTICFKLDSVSSKL